MSNVSEPGYDWLKDQMSRNGFKNLDDLTVATGINKGTISKYFRWKQRPSIDVIPVFCEALRCSPEELLVALNVIRERD